MRKYVTHQDMSIVGLFGIFVAIVVIVLINIIADLKSRVDRLDFENHKQNHVIERIRPECIGPGVEQIRQVVQ